MGLDQKILHSSEVHEQLMQRKRERYAATSHEFAEQTGIPFTPIDPKTDFREEFRAMKLSILESVRKAALNIPHGTRWHVLKTSDDSQGRFDYADDLKRIFGENLHSILVYGSSAFGTAGSDFDNFVVVHDVEKAYDQARNFNLHFAGLPVHLNFVPADLAPILLTAVVIPTVRYPWLTAIAGEIAVPELPPNLVYLQGRARSLDLMDRRQQIILNDCDHVVEYLSELPAREANAVFSAITLIPSIMIEWTARYAQRRDARPFTKKEILGALAREGLAVPQYKRDREALRQELRASLDFTDSVLTKRLGLPIDGIATFSSASKFQEIGDWISAVRADEPRIGELVKKLEAPGIKVELNLADRDSSALCYRAEFTNSDGSRTNVFLRLKDFQSGADLVITNMTTLPITRTSQGHGTRAIQTVLKWARENHLTIVLATQISDPSSQRFWEKNGFSRCDEPNETGDYKIVLS